MLVAAFLIVALILFVLAAGWPGIPAAPVQLGWLGLAFFTLAFLWPKLAGG